MLLIDAFNIQKGGGLVLLRYLVDELVKKEVDLTIIIRDGLGFSSSKYHTIHCQSSSLIQREKHITICFEKYNISTLFCFGNFASLVKRKARTIVYFHNPHLNSWISDEPIVKKIYLKLNLRHADEYWFQTKTQERLFLKFNKYSKKTRIIPFYDDSIFSQILAKKPTKKLCFVYNSLPYHHKNYERLFSVWTKLKNDGYDFELHITFPKNDLGLEVPSNCKIINHGKLEFTEVLTLLSQNAICLYPSTLETFGLGMIEAAHLGCKVVSSNLENTFDIITPSLTFDPLDESSLYDAILHSYENFDSLPNTEIHAKNEINTLIHSLTEIE